MPRAARLSHFGGSAIGAAVQRAQLPGFSPHNAPWQLILTHQEQKNGDPK